MRLDTLYLWYLGDPAAPRYVGELKLDAEELLTQRRGFDSAGFHTAVARRKKPGPFGRR